jgi:3-deoxy-manno-octulosonate cytidylyltransferase (CMP-KDO synthetase)
VSFTVVIPARYQSTRLPGKPLLSIAGRPMIVHVYERALQSGAGAVIVATDDQRIADAAQAFGAAVCMTSPAHGSGTERVAEVAEMRGAADEDVYVNVQGDEPLIPPVIVRQVADNLAARPEADIATLCTPMPDDRSVFDPSVVKVVCNADGYALYFSRATIPWHRDHFARAPGTRPPDTEYWRHIGIYAYRAGYLREHVRTPPCSLERTENLEQLRALHSGRRIHVARALEPPGPGVDTTEDLEAVRGLMER